MSKIDKLSILGVRSFDNAVSETIQFYSPLTLIVGHNGSGKTTIIECLKYATTGDLPPNSKGGAFIHDPKLCGEKEVLAQVKLQFKATSGAKMVATRSLQLTVKKTVRSQKTLEGHLLMIKDGERIGVSSRVAELDQMMPQYLGVSKAVLDNVVFCHQDESLWPMSEPASLKKKFDEIFEALKYTKAIDNIKVLRKKQTEELAKFRIMEQHAKEAKDKGERAERRSEVLGAEIETIRKQADKLLEQSKVATTQVDIAWEKRNRSHNIVHELNQKRNEEKQTLTNIERVQKNLELMDDSDEALKSMLDQYEERAALLEQDIKVQKGRYAETQQQLQDNRGALGQKQQELGLQRAEKNQYERKLRERESSIKETARRHNIRGFDHELDDEQVRDFMERLVRMVRDQTISEDREKSESEQEVKAAQVFLNDLNQRKIALAQSKESTRSQINANDKRIAGHQKSINEIEVDEGARATLDAALQDIRSQLDKLKLDSEATNFEKHIQEAERKVRDIEELKEQLQTELAQVTKHATDTARVDFLRKSLRDSQRGLQTMKGAHGDRITHTIGTHWSLDTLESDFKGSLDAKVAEIRDAEQQRNGTSRELEQVEFKLNTARKDLKRKATEARDCENQLKDTLEEGEEYEEALRTLETNRDILKGDMDSFSSMGDYYKECEVLFKKADVCRLCERTFKLDKERTKFAAKLEKNISEAAQDTIKNELESIDAELKNLRLLRPAYEIFQRLTTIELPSLENEVKRLDPIREGLLSQIEQQDRVVEERNSARRDVESLSQTVQSITKYISDIRTFETQIEEMTAKQSQKGLARGAEAIAEQQKEVNEQYRTTSKTLATLQGERDRSKEEINNLEFEVRDIKASLSDVDRKLSDKSNIAAQIDALLSDNNEFKLKTKHIDDEIQRLAPQITQSQAKLDDVKHRGDERLRVLDEKTKKLSESLRHLQMAEKEVNAYIDKNGTQQLARAERELQNLQEDGTRIEQEQTRRTVEINKLQTQQTSHVNIRTSMENNLTYREDTRTLQRVRAEIAELDSHNALEDSQHWETVANKHSHDRGRMEGERAGLLGEMKSKDNQLMQLLSDWNTDYKDAPAKYKEAHIKVEVTKAAVEDLGRYGGALDNAIMKYHSIKMEEINRIIEELWKRTYQGTDVDTILIRSDNENLKGNKSYNYRVCMVKQDAEMDMRGRCSAGQRVLASIIIRLALAECFGTNCGLIALDEPTTNLDRDNIRSLASSLHDIIKARQGQSNFQLIVITHDEEFLRYMQCADFCDHYYRISRNERQKSTIERQSIADVMD